MMGNTKRKQLLDWFPKARQSATSLSITSPIDVGYNCVAWAMERTDRWWQPAHPFAYWPSPEPETGLAAYVRMFEGHGYAACESSAHERGFAKIAIYVDAAGGFLHVAKLLESGRWSSKCGQQSDISHSNAELLEGTEYGRVWGFMKRPR